MEEALALVETSMGIMAQQTPEAAVAVQEDPLLLQQLAAQVVQVFALLSIGVKHGTLCKN